MPTISRFYGIEIRMFFSEKHKPHFHALYGEYRAMIEIDTGEVSAGYLPSPQLRLVTKWSALHQQELLEDWERARQSKPMLKIVPLK